MTVQPVSYAPQQAAWNGYQQQQPRRRMQGLSFLVHAPPKYGKSTFGDSGPGPRLSIDVEGASYWTPSEKIYWDPLREAVPVPDRRLTAGYGQPSITPAWQTAIALVREAKTVAGIYNVLNSGQHPFHCVTMDSVTEVQQRIIDDLTAGRAMDRDKWGTLLRQVSKMVRMYRDLITHPVKPVWAMTFIAGTHWDTKVSKWRPMVQGQAQDYLPYYVDVLGYINAMQDGTRHMLIGPHPHYETGERIHGRLPLTMLLGDENHPGYTIQTMLQQVLQGGRS